MNTLAFSLARSPYTSFLGFSIREQGRECQTCEGERRSSRNPNITEKHLKREIQATREKKSLRFILVTDALEMLRDTSTLAEQQFHFRLL